MPPLKLSAKTLETIEYLEAVLKEADHLAALVEQYAAAKKGGDMYSTQVSRELGQLRQKAMMRNLGFVADAAGQLSVMASRGGSPMMKARVLRDGVASFRALVERTIKGTVAADENEQKEKAFLHEKEVKAEAEHIRARVLAEEAKEAAKRASVAAAAPQPATPAGAGKPAAAKPAAPPTAKPGAPATVPGQKPAAPAASAGAPKPAPAPAARPAAAPAQKPAGASPAAAAPAARPAPAAAPGGASKPSTVNPPAGPRFVGKPHVAAAPVPAGAPSAANSPATAAPAPPGKVPDPALAPHAPAKPAAPAAVPTKPRE